MQRAYGTVLNIGARGGEYSSNKRSTCVQVLARACGGLGFSQRRTIREGKRAKNSAIALRLRHLPRRVGRGVVLGDTQKHLFGHAEHLRENILKSSSKRRGAGPAVGSGEVHSRRGGREGGQGGDRIWLNFTSSEVPFSSYFESCLVVEGPVSPRQTFVLPHAV